MACKSSKMLEPVVPTTSPTPCSVALWIWVVRHRERTRPKTEALSFFLFPWECSSPRTCQSGNPLCHAMCLTGIMAVARLYAFPRVAALLWKVTGAMHRGWRFIAKRDWKAGGFRIVLNSAGHFRGHLLFLPVVFFFPWRMFFFFVRGFGFLFFQRSSFQQCNQQLQYQLYISWRELDKVQQLFKKARGDGGREGWEKVPVTSHASVSWLYGIHFRTLDVIIPMNSWLDLGVIPVYFCFIGNPFGNYGSVSYSDSRWRGSSRAPPHMEIQHTWRKWWGRLITARAKPWFFGIQVRYSIVFQLLTVDM